MMPDFEKIFVKEKPRSKPMLTDELRQLMNLPSAPAAPPMPTDTLPPEQRPQLNALPYNLPQPEPMPDFAAAQEQQQQEMVMRRNMEIIKALMFGGGQPGHGTPAINMPGMGPQDLLLPGPQGGLDQYSAPEFGWDQGNVMNRLMQLLETSFPGGNLQR